LIKAKVIEEIKSVTSERKFLILRTVLSSLRTVVDPEHLR
jgi:hypothetical protein